MADFLRWTERASDEYNKLSEYLLSEWGEQITLKVLFEINQTLIQIKNRPEHYPYFIKRKKIRRCVVSPQTSIFFKVIDSVVEIQSMFDNRQNPKKRKL